MSFKTKYELEKCQNLRRKKLKTHISFTKSINDNFGIDIVMPIFERTAISVMVKSVKKQINFFDYESFCLKKTCQSFV